jgi:2-dehydropantoate 2-reductase
MPLPSSLRIAVLGVGNIGSTFAFQLARAGHHNVTVVARPNSPRFRQLQRDNGIVNVKGERAEVEVTDTLDEKTPYDLVIVTLLAHQIDAVLPALARSAAKCIQFMFNTFEPERLQDAIGAERCAFGMPFVQARLDRDGRLKAVIGAGGQKSIMSRQASVDLFIRAGLPAALEPDMPLWLRCHAPLCIAFESVSVAGMRRGGGASWAESMTLAHGLHESFALIKGLGYRLYPKGKSRLSRSPAWALAFILWTLSRVTPFRELLATGLHECRALTDMIITAAPRANPPVNAARIEAMKPREEPTSAL